MKVQILPLLEGAKQARGLTVIIDVFRAFSLEAYLQEKGAKEIIPVATIEEAFQLRQQFPEAILVGERNGIMVPGFDFGNSPSELEQVEVRGKRIIHTTSAGVQGLIAAKNASEIVTGALVNAKATCNYILSKKPEIVSLVPMGWNGIQETDEDQVCAEYMASLLQDSQGPDLEKRIEALKEGEGKKFFDPTKPQFPQGDFALCTKVDCLNGVNRVNVLYNQYYMKWEKYDE